KMVELSIYDGIPHLLLPVVTDAQKASLALRWAVDEMERRYRLIYETRVRHIEAYNEKQADAANKLPYLVVVIDEFADLMTIAPKDVEWSVQRLAQKARAAGIHVILATQRPSVDVITPVIRANFPVRVAFYVKDAVNSRVILDQAGAATLLGAGDMLHQDKDLVQRVHGAYVSEEEIHAVVEFLKAQGSPEYNMDILRPREEDDEAVGGGDAGPVDEMYARAIDFVRQTRIASISRLQRELGVGYNRAAKMIERMEKDGIVGPGDGAKPREVMGGVASFAAGAPPPLPM
ncbi:MAG: FtsK/SpoIIIE domain-containing protein, partial [Myxococcota bacterium]